MPTGGREWVGSRYWHTRVQSQPNILAINIDYVG